MKMTTMILNVCGVFFVFGILFLCYGATSPSTLPEENASELSDTTAPSANGSDTPPQPQGGGGCCCNGGPCSCCSEPAAAAAEENYNQSSLAGTPYAGAALLPFFTAAYENAIQKNWEAKPYDPKNLNALTTAFDEVKGNFNQTDPYTQAMTPWWAKQQASAK